MMMELVMMGLWIDQEAIKQAMMAKRLILSLSATSDLLPTMAPPTATPIGDTFRDRGCACVHERANRQIVAEPLQTTTVK